MKYICSISVDRCEYLTIWSAVASFRGQIFSRSLWRIAETRAPLWWQQEAVGGGGAVVIWMILNRSEQRNGKRVSVICDGCDAVGMLSRSIWPVETGEARWHFECWLNSKWLHSRIIIIIKWKECLRAVSYSCVAEETMLNVEECVCHSIE